MSAPLKPAKLPGEKRDKKRLKAQRKAAKSAVVPLTVAASRPRFKVSPEALGRSRIVSPRNDLGITSSMLNGISEAFRIAPPPPGVVPAGVKPMAMDQDLGAWSQGLSGWTENLTWLGMPFLAELAQRAEYRQIVETHAKEMTRRWIKVSATGDDDKTDKVAVIEKALKKYKVRQKFRRLAELDGFFGRGHLYINTGYTQDRELLKVPLILDRRTFEPGTLKGFHVVEPVWTYPGNYDSLDPLEDDFYTPRTWYVMGKEVHRTRLMTLVSREVPDILKPSYQFGGISMSQLARPYIDNWLRTRQSISDLVHSFSTMIMSTDMSSVLGDGVGGGADLFDRIEMFNNFRDNNGMMAIDKDREELSNVVTPLGTLDHLQAQAQEQLASVSHIPLIVLLGITPSGLNASSDGELQAWASWVKSMQEHLFDDPLDRVIQCIQIDEWGEIDPDITFDYEPLRELSDAEEAAARKQEADTHKVYVDAGVIAPDEVRQSLAGDEDNPYAGIDLSGPPPDPPQLEPDPLGGNPTGGPPNAPGGPPGAPPSRASFDGVVPPDRITDLAAAIAARRGEDARHRRVRAALPDAMDDAAYEHWWEGRPDKTQDIAAAIQRLADVLARPGGGTGALLNALPDEDVVEGGTWDALDEDLKPVERRQYGTLQIGIETRMGEVRSGNGWSVEMPADYGYIMRTEGADGDRVDVFVGIFAPADLPAFIIEQHHLDGRPDEHKVMIGFQTLPEALAIYDRSYSDGSGPDRRGEVHQVPFDELRAWLRAVKD